MRTKTLEGGISIEVRKLYSPLIVYANNHKHDSAYSTNRKYFDGIFREDILDSKEAANYKELIQESLHDNLMYNLHKNSDMGLMKYFMPIYDTELSESIREKVKFAWPAVEVHNANLYGVLVYESDSPLNKEEMKAFKDDFAISYKHGWGDKFEFTDINIPSGDELHIRFWHKSKNYFLCDEAEFMSKTNNCVDLNAVKQNPYENRMADLLQYESRLEEPQGPQLMQ